MYSCSSSKTAPANLPVQVNLFTVQLQAATYYDVYPGNIVALSQVDLKPQVQGKMAILEDRALAYREGLAAGIALAKPYAARLAI